MVIFLKTIYFLERFDECTRNYNFELFLKKMAFTCPIPCGNMLVLDSYNYSECLELLFESKNKHCGRLSTIVTNVTNAHFAHSSQLY